MCDRGRRSARLTVRVLKSAEARRCGLEAGLTAPPPLTPSVTTAKLTPGTVLLGGLKPPNIGGLERESKLIDLKASVRVQPLKGRQFVHVAAHSEFICAPVVRVDEATDRVRAFSLQAVSVFIYCSQDVLHVAGGKSGRVFAQVFVQEPQRGVLDDRPPKIRQQARLGQSVLCSRALVVSRAEPAATAERVSIHECLHPNSHRARSSRFHRS